MASTSSRKWWGTAVGTAGMAALMVDNRSVVKEYTMIVGLNRAEKELQGALNSPLLDAAQISRRMRRESLSNQISP